MFFPIKTYVRRPLYIVPVLLTLYLNLIILQWFSLCLKHFEKYVISKRYITARKIYISAQNEIEGVAPTERDPFNHIFKIMVQQKIS